jgi:hypothetical protein
MSCMKLSEKGVFAPPPVLPKHAQSVSELVASWARVHARAHWRLGDETIVDGADFYVGEAELGHIHLEGEAHIALPRKLKSALVKAGRAKPFRWSDEFAVFAIRGASDIDNATFLFKIAYDALLGVDEALLLARCCTPSVRAS